MSGTDHPPSTNGPARTTARRALWSSLAVVVAVMGSVSLASAANRPERAGAAEATAPTLDEARQLMRARPDLVAPLADIETVAEAVAPPTTVVAPTTTTTAPPPPPAPQPVATGTGYADPNNPAAWDRLAQCESGGNWSVNTGNGYYGGIQFSLGSWRGVGGPGYPHEASRETQIAMGQRLYSQGGWSHWPACTHELGYR